MRKLKIIAAAVATSLFYGCSLAPVYHLPPIDIPVAYKEPGPWQTSRPSDRLPRGDWWISAHDTELSRLELQVDKANPDLAAAVARYDEATAFLSQTRAGLFPQLGVGGALTNNRQSDNRPLRGSGEPSVYGANSLTFELDYDFDLWGRVHNEVAANKDLAQAGAAEMESVRLSLHIKLADAYFSLRGDDEKLKLLRDSEAAYAHALKVTTTLFHGGVAPAEDMTRAGTNLYTVRAQIDEIEAQRALSEHAIASLAGISASSFAIPPDANPVNFDAIPLDVPSALLQRRPDIAAAERRVAAANASIGIARAAFFPDISLSPMMGFQSDSTANLLSASNLIWAIGPQLSATLFDAGLHRAELAAARAKLNESAANYRSTVLRGFQEVEDNLALLSHLRDEAQAEDLAVQNAQRTLKFSFNQYQAGAVSYLDVFEAQTAALQVSQSAIDLRVRYLHACVGLVGALGGGWPGIKADQTGLPAAQIPGAKTRSPVEAPTDAGLALS